MHIQLDMILNNMLSQPNVDNTGVLALLFQYEYYAGDGGNCLIHNNAFTRIGLKITSPVKETLG